MRLLTRVLPGMIAARHGAAMCAPGDSDSGAARKRPIIFSFAFPLRGDAETAARDVLDELVCFARSINVRLPDLHGRPHASALPGHMKILAERIHADGGVLWVLLDELQAPILNSSPAAAADFMVYFKKVRCTLRGGGRASRTRTCSRPIEPQSSPIRTPTPFRQRRPWRRAARLRASR